MPQESLFSFSKFVTLLSDSENPGFHYHICLFDQSLILLPPASCMDTLIIRKLWQFAETTFLEDALLIPLGLWHPEPDHTPMWVPSSLSLGFNIHVSLLWEYLLHSSWSLKLCTALSSYVDLLLILHCTLGCCHSSWTPFSSQLGSDHFALDNYCSPLASFHSTKTPTSLTLNLRLQNWTVQERKRRSCISCGMLYCTLCVKNYRDWSWCFPQEITP